MRIFKSNMALYDQRACLVGSGCLERFSTSLCTQQVNENIPWMIVYRKAINEEGDGNDTYIIVILYSVTHGLTFKVDSLCARPEQSLVQCVPRYVLVWVSSELTPGL